MLVFGLGNVMKEDKFVFLGQFQFFKWHNSTEGLQSEVNWKNRNRGQFSGHFVFSVVWNIN